jgi:hypothetical protein
MLAGYAGMRTGYRSRRRLIRSATHLAPVYFVLLQVNPEEHGITYEVLDGDSHGLQFRKCEMFGVLPFPLHPVQ